MNGNDSSNNCLSSAAPCLTIAHGIASMQGGDTLLIGDGNYKEPVKGMPSGTANGYTTVRALNDWGVTIDGSGWDNSYSTGANGITVGSRSYVVVRGFHVKMRQLDLTNPTTNPMVNEPIMVVSSDHVKIQRCSASYGPATGNAASIDIGPASSYILIEECYAFGGSRYQYLVYQSDHVIVRRSVARNDYWHDTLQCAGFTNYNSDNTIWENDIAIDSDGTSNCTDPSSTTTYLGGHQFAGFFNENKPPDSTNLPWSASTETIETFRGNIVLNVVAFYSGMYDYDISNTHTYSNNIIWNSHGGLYADYQHGDPAVLNVTNMTVGNITAPSGTSYASEEPNGQGGAGVGIAVIDNTVTNSITNSILWNNAFYGLADYAVGNFNSYWNNASGPYGGVSGSVPAPSPGANDQTGNLTSGLKYLPRIEPGSALATAGSGGSQIGADARYMWGATGTLWGDPGYDSVTSECLWPFPNEDVIKSDMASYSGPGGAGQRGFTAGTSKDGSPQSLTKYIWEYLGNQIPSGSLCP